MITIIGILIALLLPAVQAAREAARQTQCKNNLKQLALGCMNHENATGRLPGGGWGYSWTGDADRGTDWRQPGGWLFNILPYVEQQALHDMGAGLPWNDTQKKSLHIQRMSVPLAGLYCPTRRKVIAYPWNLAGNAGGGSPVVNAGTPSVVGRSDYACNGGYMYTHCGNPIPAAWAENVAGGSGPSNVTAVENPPGQMTTAARTTFNNVGKNATGVIFCGSMIRLSDITDGASNTYVAGEKYLNPDSYDNGTDGADNEHALMGDNPDISRFGIYPPQQDTPASVTYGFGSAHANGFHMAFCDGSVSMMNYTLDPTIHGCLCQRADGQPISGSKL